MKRREFLATGAALAAAPLLRAEDDPGNGWRQVIARLTGGCAPQPGRVRLELPRIADNPYLSIQLVAEASGDVSVEWATTHGEKGEIRAAIAVE